MPFRVLLFFLLVCSPYYSFVHRLVKLCIFVFWKWQSAYIYQAWAQIIRSLPFANQQQQDLAFFIFVFNFGALKCCLIDIAI